MLPQWARVQSSADRVGWVYHVWICAMSKSGLLLPYVESGHCFRVLTPTVAQLLGLSATAPPSITHHAKRPTSPLYLLHLLHRHLHLHLHLHLHRRPLTTPGRALIPTTLGRRVPVAISRPRPRPYRSPAQTQRQRQAQSRAIVAVTPFR